MKNTKISYRKRRNLMLKKHSDLSIFRCLCNITKQNGLIKPFKRGRPCEIPKHKLICFILYKKSYDNGLEEMELSSELFLGRHYDHGTFGYHYKNLKGEVIESITWHYERLIMQILEKDILFHIFDSTAISTSVREERIRQGTRNKTKITQKVHTMLGYDPPNQLVVVEGCKATTNSVSDNQGALIMLRDDKKGYSLGDGAYETYELIEETEKKGLYPIYKPQKRAIRKKLSAKKRVRERWSGNAHRIYKEIRGVGEVLYGAATRAGLIKSDCRLVENQHKDGLIIGLRQNMLTYLRLKALIRIIRKTLFNNNL
jgi:hypothetical protein